MSDYEDDPKGELRLTDPYGNEMNEQKAGACGGCDICEATCSYKDNNCYGSVNMTSDMTHRCEFHRRHGAPNNWFVSEETDKESPFPRELGMQGDNVKESGNNGFEYKDEEDTGRDYESEDPHYTNG